MAELIALYMVCKNIGVIARQRGVRARPFQMRAIFLWIGFEFVGSFVGAVIGLRGVLVYIAAFVGALISLHFSFKAVRDARPAPKPPTIVKTAPPQSVPTEKLQ